MKAFVYEGPGKMMVKDVPKPKPEAGEVLIKPLYTGICYTDKNAYEYDYFVYRDWKGMTQGHETSGEIVELGPGVEGLKVGDRVAIDPRTYCGECGMCRAGWMTVCERKAGWIGINTRRDNGEFCHGAMAEYCVVPDYTCFKVADTVSDIAATNAEAVACGERYVRWSGIQVGDNVAVLGLEDYALSSMQWARLAGAKQVVAADPYKIRRDVAKKLGADVVIDPTTTDVVQAVREIMPFGPDIVFVSSETYIKPSLEYFGQASQMARMQGKLVLARCYSNEAFASIDPTTYWCKELNLAGYGIYFGEEPSRGGRSRGDFQHTVDTLAEKKIDAETHATMIVPFDEVNTKEDLDALYKSYPEKAVKILFKIWGK